MNKAEKFLRETILPFKEDKEYKVAINDIKIPYCFKMRPPKKWKMDKKWEYFNRHCKTESKIILDKNFILIDGYTSYLIWDRYLSDSPKLKSKKVIPVYFDMDAEGLG